MTITISKARVRLTPNGKVESGWVVRSSGEIISQHKTKKSAEKSAKRIRSLRKRLGFRK